MCVQEKRYIGMQTIHMIKPKLLTLSYRYITVLNKNLVDIAIVFFN